MALLNWNAKCLAENVLYFQCLSYSLMTVYNKIVEHKYLCHCLILVLMESVGVTVYNGGRIKKNIAS